MNRLTLKPQKTQPDCFIIRDRLDDKKLGHIQLIDEKLRIKIKKKFRNNHLKKEAQYTFNNHTNKWKDAYHKILKTINHNFLNIDDYHLPMFAEACRLKYSGNDMFDRPAYLHPVARKAWKKMRNAARGDNIDLQIISAFRSIEYQKKLIERKLNQNISIENIINVSALPGFSEHHTGCAIDIGSKEASVLEETFDQSMAFLWLTGNAKKFGFYLSYPKGNTTGICYEPWHWCYKKVD